MVTLVHYFSIFLYIYSTGAPLTTNALDVFKNDQQRQQAAAGSSSGSKQQQQEAALSKTKRYIRRQVKRHYLTLRLLSFNGRSRRRCRHRSRSPRAAAAAAGACAPRVALLPSRPISLTPSAANDSNARCCGQAPRGHRCRPRQPRPAQPAAGAGAGGSARARSRAAGAQPRAMRGGGFMRACSMLFLFSMLFFRSWPSQAPKRTCPLYIRSRKLWQQRAEISRHLCSRSSIKALSRIHPRSCCRSPTPPPPPLPLFLPMPNRV